MSIKFIWWGSCWQGFGFWQWPERGHRWYQFEKNPCFVGWRFGFFEVRYYPPVIHVRHMTVEEIADEVDRIRGEVERLTEEVEQYKKNDL